MGIKTFNESGWHIAGTDSYERVDEHLQALELIVKKGVNVKQFIEELGWDKFDYEFYLCNYRHYSNEELTQAEFDFVLKVVKEVLGNEC